MIPEWLSFQNEFIPSPYISLYLFTWYRDEISPPHKSFRSEFIPVFNPNEIVVLVWYFVLVSCKLKTNSVPRWKRKPCSLGRVAHAYRFQNWGQNGRFQDSWAGRFCHANAVRTSFWNETHSGMKLILVSCEQPLTWLSQGCLTCSSFPCNMSVQKAQIAPDLRIQLWWKTRLFFGEIPRKTFVTISFFYFHFRVD